MNQNYYYLYVLVALCIILITQCDIVLGTNVSHEDRRINLNLELYDQIPEHSARTSRRAYEELNILKIKLKQIESEANQMQGLSVDCATSPIQINDPQKILKIRYSPDSHKRSWQLSNPTIHLRNSPMYNP